MGLGDTRKRQLLKAILAGGESHMGNQKKHGHKYRERKRLVDLGGLSGHGTIIHSCHGILTLYIQDLFNSLCQSTRCIITAIR